MKVFITLVFVITFSFINGCGFHYLSLSYTDEDLGASATVQISENNFGLAIARQADKR